MTVLNSAGVRPVCGRFLKTKDAYKDHRWPYYMGVELELENLTGGDRNVELVMWTTHNDESLRNGIEFVSADAIAGDVLAASIDSFYRRAFKYTNGPRTSTHIHCNASDMTVGEVRAMVLITYALEDALFRHIEGSRKYCGYCMPLSEMNPARFNAVINCATIEQFHRQLGGHNADKYYGLNLNSLRKHGTVEFRYFPGGPKKEELESWLDYVTAVRRAAQAGGVAGLLALETEDQFAAWLNDNFGAWAGRFEAVLGIPQLFANLRDGLAAIEDEVEVQRREPIVYATDGLIAAACRLNFGNKPHQVKHFSGRMKALGAVTLNEWLQVLDETRYMDPPVDKVQAVNPQEVFDNIFDAPVVQPAAVGAAQREQDRINGLYQRLAALNADAAAPRPVIRARPRPLA